jgi:hypothetical protein
VVPTRKFLLGSVIESFLADDCEELNLVVEEVSVVEW